MKKNIIFTAIAAMLLTASCTQQDDFLPGNEAKTFTATIEQVQPQTRTALSDADGVTVSWSAGDQVDINGATYSAKILGKKGEAILTYESGDAPKEGPYTAVYPASLWKTEGHERVIEFPNVQYYESGKLNAPMCATSTSDKLTFHNICGVICFSLTGAEKIRGIQVSAADIPLYGTVTVDSENNYIAKVDAQYKEDQKETQVLANNKITLDCGTDGVQLINEKPTKFYMYLPETTFGAGELDIYIYGMKGIDSEQAYHRTASKTVTIQSNKIYTLNLNVSFDEVALDPVLPGKFSVSAGKQVQFSRGNLQATKDKTTSEWTWGFAPQQYTYIGDKNVSGTGEDANLASTIDLFGWSSTAKDNNFGIFTATTSERGGAEYFSDDCTFNDWANNVNLGDRNWRTLSDTEWSYLLDRTQEANCAGSARKANVNGTCGLLLLPDGFSEHESYGDCKTIVTRCEDNLSEPFPNEGLSLAEWKMLQSAGCVFLPCAGSREGISVAMAGSNGHYWSSTSQKHLKFESNEVNVSYYGNYIGCSVRLVTNVASEQDKDSK